MKNKHVKSFIELNENKNLNISDVISELDILISSQETQEKKGNLTDTGIAYLNGLKKARKIIGKLNI